MKKYFIWGCGILFMFLIACSEEQEVLDITDSLSFDEDTLEDEELLKEGGTVYLKVKWENVKWNITAGDVIKGQSFISNISPDHGGYVNGESGTTTVVLVYSFNTNANINRQQLILNSENNELSDTLILTQASNPVQKMNVTLKPDMTYQTIAGFGGCNSVFRGSANYPNATDIQKAFGTGDGELGLSIFRVSIPTDDSRWAAVAKVAGYAHQLDAKVFATPWDAPEELRDSENEEERVLLPSKYGDYVNHLNSFDTYMSNNGVDLYAISVQNEPDIGDWTQWTPEEVYDFMKNYANDINHSRVITPESFNFNRKYYNDLLADEETRANFEIVGGHIYGNGLGEIPAAEQYGKEIWMTEYLLNEYTGDFENSDTPWADIPDDEVWEQSIDMLISVHEAMMSNWNAYIWWYLKRYYSFIGDGLEGSVDGEVLKRGYAFSHFSKFIRPGYVRIGTQVEDASTGLLISAYKGENKIVTVIINPTANTIRGVNLVTSNSNPSALVYTTSVTQDQEMTTLTGSSTEFLLEAQAKSITTVVINQSN